MTILDRAVVEAVIPELGVEPDDQQALRKALLTLIRLTQDEASDDVSAFIDYLLLSFSPVSASFVNDRHSFVRGEHVTRDRSGDHARLLLRDEFIQELVAEVEKRS